MEWLDNPGSAEGLDLELPQAAEPGDAVGEVRAVHYHTYHTYDTVRYSVTPSAR